MNNGRDNRNNSERKKLPGYPLTARDKRMARGDRLSRKQARK